MMKIRWAHGLICLIVLGTECKAQRPGIRREIRTWRQAQKQYLPVSFSLRAGSTQFWGELRQQNFSWNYGAGIQFNFKHAEAFSIGLDVHKGNLSGRRKRFFNSAFRNDYVSAEFIPRWDVVRAIRRDSEERLCIQVYSGIGLSFFSAEAFDLTSGERVRFTNNPIHSSRNALFKRYGTPYRKVGISKTHERIIPVGIAPSYSLVKGLSAGVDIRFHFVRTDKMDATSGYRLINPEEADSYSNTPNDLYSSATVFLNYRFLTKRR